MRHQSPQTCQKEEDKARDQNIAKFVRRPQCCCASGCREGQPKQNAVLDI